MRLTDYHAKYFAHAITRRCASDSVEKLAGTLVDAQVSLNPHQVDAALFAFKSPLSRGAILADEVGLGKTIEAGLVLSQKWAERKRRLLVITPANLRQQWQQELQEKFFLPCRILEAKFYNTAIRQGISQPFDTEELLICSYEFARSKAMDIQAIRWDLVVLDEAHRLRNVYKPSNVIANTLQQALKDTPKLLLTATPLQNSLLELYGLVSFIDDRTFGDLKSFREQFANLNNPRVFERLKARLKPVCQRTLRRQVLPYVRFPDRFPMLHRFIPAENEERLYQLVSAYLQRDNLQALPAGQRLLMTLVLRKLLASSTFAIAGALESLSRRLRTCLQQADAAEELTDALHDDFEAMDTLAEEWGEEATTPAPLTRDERTALGQEIAELEQFRDLAHSITDNAKGVVLLTALQAAFAKADELGAARKAIIFTESRRTQDYILRVLTDSPYKDGVVLFNGTNTDTQSRQIYAAWRTRHKDTDRITGSPSADMRSALVDYFREQGQIMVATEAGAEGINLQFCSLVVNYDLPWNPQRIEQRIGRCHRYGQRHDVVVVNFLNQNNAADQRVFELLAKKFALFEGVFGASDEVLGAIESGVDFEKRIVDIYQRCRTPEAINASFDQLQQELSQQIDEAMTRTRRQLLENFDEEVLEKLRVSRESSTAYLDRYEQMLLDVTRHELRDHARFLNGQSAFRLASCPFPGNIPLGLYELPRRSGEAHLYRLAHPLAQHVVAQAKDRALPAAAMVFDYTNTLPTVSILQLLVGQHGVLRLSLLTVESLDQTEDYLIIAALTDDGQVLDEEQASRVLRLPAQECRPCATPFVSEPLVALTASRQAAILTSISRRNADFFEAEANKLDEWADDLKAGVEREIKELDRQIKEARRAATAALTLEEKLDAQKRVKAIEAQRNSRRRALFDAQDDIDRRREALISEIEGKLQQQTTLQELFSLRWTIV